MGNGKTGFMINGIKFMLRVESVITVVSVETLPQEYFTG